MSDEPRTPEQSSADDFLARYHEHEARAAELHPSNKAALFAALRDAGIASVLVHFDGYGDSGQIEDVDAVATDQTARDIPATVVELQQLNFGMTEPALVSLPLRDAIETLAYALLESVHGGWENNEGAFGDFTFDVAAGTISLDYNERYETSENYTHEF